MAMAFSLNIYNPNPFPPLQRVRFDGHSCSTSFTGTGEFKQLLSPIASKIGQKLSCSTSGSDPELEPQADSEADNVGVKVALSMLNFYKREISPLLPKSCRYVPTCSEYSMIAYKKYGVVKGTILTTWRLCRCNPLGGSGFDPPRWFGEESTLEE